MEVINALSALVGNIGLPSVMVIGGGYIFYKRIWPDLINLGTLYATALCRVADALDSFATKMPDPYAPKVGEK